MNIHCQSSNLTTFSNLMDKNATWYLIKQPYVNAVIISLRFWNGYNIKFILRNA